MEVISLFLPNLILQSSKGKLEAADRAKNPEADYRLRVGVCRLLLTDLGQKSDHNGQSPHQHIHMPGICRGMY